MFHRFCRMCQQKGKLKCCLNFDQPCKAISANMTQAWHQASLVLNIYKQLTRMENCKYLKPGVLCAIQQTRCIPAWLREDPWGKSSSTLDFCWTPPCIFGHVWGTFFLALFQAGKSSSKSLVLGQAPPSLEKCPNPLQLHQKAKSTNSLK